LKQVRSGYFSTLSKTHPYFPRLFRFSPSDRTRIGAGDAGSTDEHAVAHKLLQADGPDVQPPQAQGDGRGARFDIDAHQGGGRSGGGGRIRWPAAAAAADEPQPARVSGAPAAL